MHWIPVGILAALYVGYRLVEVVRGPSEDRSSASHTGKESSPTDKPSETNQAFYQHHTQSGAIGMGLAATTFVFPQLAIPSLAFTFYSSLPIIRKAEQSLFEENKVTNDVLSSVVVFSSLGIGSIFAPALQAGVYHLGEYMALGGRATSQRSIIKALDQPTTTQVARVADGDDVSLQSLQVGATVIVRSGEVIPIDGTVCAGTAEVDQSALTGEALPAILRTGDQAFAASTVIHGELRIIVERSGADTVAAQLAEILENTILYKSQLQLKGEEWSDRVALPLLLLSSGALMAVGPSVAAGMLFAAPTNAIQAVASLQTSSHLTSLTRRGILIKDGRALEVLSEIDTVMFDKTGTLTRLSLDVQAIHTLGDLDERSILRLVGSTEHRVNHPIAEALTRHCVEQSVPLHPNINRRVHIGLGVEAEVDGRMVRVGSADLVPREALPLSPHLQERLSTVQKQGISVVWVVVDGELQGIVELSPQIRPEAQSTVDSLRALGISRILLVSGDSEGPTKYISEQLSLDGHYYSTLPQDKAALVNTLQSMGHRVCFIGDGINDGPAMREADVAISLAGASTVATDSAQIVLLNSELTRLPETLAGAQSLSRGLRFTLMYWTGFGVADILGAAVLHIGVVPWSLAYGTVFALGIAQANWPLIGDEVSEAV